MLNGTQMDKNIQQPKSNVYPSPSERKDKINRAVQPYTLLYYRWSIYHNGSSRLRMSEANTVVGERLILDLPKRYEFNSSFDQAVVELAEHFPDLKVIGRVPNTNYLICEHYDFNKSKD